MVWCTVLINFPAAQRDRVSLPVQEKMKKVTPSFAARVSGGFLLGGRTGGADWGGGVA